MNNENQEFSSIISFSDQITDYDNTTKIDDFDRINSFSNSFMILYNSEKLKLPYHINILDLIWANENAHSRIFAELLKQKSNKGFEILESYLNYLNSINPEFDLKPRSPRITSEKERIDLLILDADFALIIENKIHNAIDQDSQIARYYEKARKQGYSEDHIYIVYLTRDENKKPDSKTWILNGIDYRELILQRFAPQSFKNNILPWLSCEVLPNCRIKDVYLKSTIEQYIDYLEGMFNLRNIEAKMNQELQNHIKMVLDLNKNPEDNYTKLTTKYNELKKAEDQIGLLLQESEKECWKLWLKRLGSDYSNLEIVDYSEADKFPKVGVAISHNGHKFSILIEKDNSGIYFGIGRHESSTEIVHETKEYLKPLLKEGFRESPWWYGYKYTSFHNGYSRLDSLIKKVILRIAE